MSMRVLLLLLLAMAMAMSTTPTTNAYNITKILAAHPEFSTFNHYLSATHLSSDINRRLTVTVLALDNAAMSSLLSRRLSLPTLKNLLSLHCLVDYYGAKKLHQLTGSTALTSSLFQATGAAPGTTGFVNITDRRGGHVSFSADIDTDTDSDSDTGTSASFVKSVKEIPYNLSIVQISAALSSPEAEAPAAAPPPVNLTVSMSKYGCRLFANLLTAASPDVLDTYQSNLDTGLTVFCPVDAAVRAFQPKFDKLKPEEQTALLLYHAEAVYNSMQQLKTGSGLSSTLAATAATANTKTKKKKKDYTFSVGEDGGGVKLETEVTTAKILKTVVDQEPVAVYSINKVLQPKELFKPPAADAPGAAAKAASADNADSPDDAPGDDKAADDNAADGRLRGGGYVWAVVAAAVSAVAVMV